MKKMIAILAVVLLAVALVACGALPSGSKTQTKTPALTPNENGHIITQFCLAEGSRNDMALPEGNTHDLFALRENVVEMETTGMSETVTIELDKAQREQLEQELLGLIELYSLQKWDGYDGEMEVSDDYHGFTLNIEYSDGTAVEARGNHMFPDHYRQVFETVQAIFATYQPEDATAQENSGAEEMTEEEKRDLKILCETLGAEYLEGQSTMRVTWDMGREPISGAHCSVYALGTNKPEQFVAQEWFAVSKGDDATVYEYDVVMDSWSVYVGAEQSFAQEDPANVENCIYMLNEYLTDEFAAEYNDAPEQVKKAIFKEVDAPERLIGMNEEIPAGYSADELERQYYPVSNFDDLDGLRAHFSQYFTARAMEEISFHLAYEFAEFDGTLYLVRGGRGYGTVSLNFDTVDTSRFADEGIVVVDCLLFGKKDGEYTVEFAYEDAVLKIDRFE